MGQDLSFLIGQSQLFAQRGERIVHIAAEVRGVVGVHAHRQPGREHAAQRMICKRIDHSQPDIRQRARRQRNLFVHQPCDEFRIFEGPDAVVDALGAE